MEQESTRVPGRRRKWNVSPKKTNGQLGFGGLGADRTNGGHSLLDRSVARAGWEVWDE